MKGDLWANKAVRKELIVGENEKKQANFAWLLPVPA